MPQRRLAGLALAVATTAAVTGCSINIDPSSVPPPFSQAPVPSASTGQPAYVCTAIYQILTSGAAKLTDSVGGRTATARQATQATLADMASRISAEGARSTDPELRRVIAGMSGDLTAAAKQSDPASYVNGDFTTIARKLDGHCD